MVKKPRKRIVVWLIIFAILVGILSYASNILQPLIIDIAEEETRSLLANKLNDKNLQLQDYVIQCGELYNYSTNDAGEIVLISANTVAINTLCMMSQYEIQNVLSTFADEKINISIGALLGGSLFADLGKNIAINVYSVGTSSVEWKTTFVSYGINQTLHRSFIVITSTINIILPMQSKTITSVNEIMIAENVIVGTVPETYLTEMDDNTALDLIP